MREIEAEAEKEAPGIAEVTKTIRHFAGRYLSGEDPHHAVIGVLSPKSGEGRTTISMVLASALAEIYSNVVLVELETDNSAMPLCREMNLGTKLGLKDYLNDEASLESVLWPTQKKNLSFLPAGPLRSQATRLDATTRIRELLAELSRKFEIVVVDLPPVLTSEEAPGLLVGLTGVVLVASAGSTTTDDVKQVLALCQPIPIKGVLLNRVRLHAPGWLASLLRS
jgi:Mrp family chromosome partitioning ATPase